MAKHSKEERLDRYFQLHHYMLKTEAWKALSAPARAVYVAIGSRYNGINNGKIACSVRDAASECNVAPGTASKALKELVAFGFIEETRHGGLSRKTRIASEWRLTAFRCDLTGALKSVLFMQRGAQAREHRQPRTRPQTGDRKPLACVSNDDRECVKRRYSLYQTTTHSSARVYQTTTHSSLFSGGAPVSNDGTLIVYHPHPASDATSADDQTLAARSGLAPPPADDAPVSDGQPPLPSQTPRPRVTRRRRASTSGRRVAK